MASSRNVAGKSIIDTLLLIRCSMYFLLPLWLFLLYSCGDRDLPVNDIPGKKNTSSDGVVSASDISGGNNTQNNKISVAKNIGHGVTQLDRLFADMPEMETHDIRGAGSLICDWVVLRFEGKGLGQVIYWNPSAPERGFDADSQFPTANIAGFIRLKRFPKDVNDDSIFAFERYWKSLIFELNNTYNAPKFIKLYSEAAAGGLNRGQWIRRATQIEYVAILATKRFFYSHWAPYCKKVGILPDRKLWNADLPEDYDLWLRQYTDPSGYPWNWWGDYYDSYLAPNKIQPGSKKMRTALAARKKSPARAAWRMP
jgi:hypothetical protein